jgi:NADPH-dependent glutamate synthase beta subunit-like oxidoreductase
MSLAVVIVGAGPAGFYTAEALLNRCPEGRIDIIERLPSPFGLVRAGVAPDHQSTKRIISRFEKTAGSASVSFFGNVEVGRDVSLDELRHLYDAVVLAVGAPRDRTLNIPGEGLKGVYGSAAFVGWYNGHPDYRDLDPLLDTESAVVIGNGNVALDIARVLAKSSAELAPSDITDAARNAIERSPLRDIHIVGRRGPADTKFTPAELREISRLETCVPVVDASTVTAQARSPAARTNPALEKNLAMFREFAERNAQGSPKRLHFTFFAAPVEIIGDERVRAIRIERTRMTNGRLERTGAVKSLPCGLVAIAIGYRGSPLPDVPYDADRGLIKSDDGRVEPCLYAVGWAKRGPTGVIGTNKPDGIQCAEQILTDGPSGTKPGRPALVRLLAERHVRCVRFEDWQRIDAAEISQALAPAPRRKFTSVEDMLSALKRDSQHARPK